MAQKLVIVTSHFENYGAHDWDGSGTCPQYWKQKSSIFYEIDAAETDIHAKDTIKLLMSMLNSDSDYYRETISELFYTDRSDTSYRDPWEPCYNLAIRAGEWVFSKIEQNDEHGCFRADVETLYKVGKMTPNIGFTDMKVLVKLKSNPEITTYSQAFNNSVSATSEHNPQLKNKQLQEDLAVAQSTEDADMDIEYDY